MNFDVNTLSTLMQFMGSAKQQERNAKPQDPPAATQDKHMSQSVFAMQNGLGERVDFTDKAQKNESAKSAAPNMQMSSLLEMIAGNKNGKQGDISSLLPLLMGMMNGNRNGQGGNDMSTLLPLLMSLMGGQNSQKSNGPPPDADDKKEDKAKPAPEEQSPPAKPRTAISKDKYEPISYAGYAMISALNKLYISQFKNRH